MRDTAATFKRDTPVYNLFTRIIITIRYPRQTWHSLSQHYAILSACCTHSTGIWLLVSTILDFWTHNLQATVISTFVVHLHWKFTIWLRTCWKSLCEVLCSSVRQIWNYTPLKSCATRYNKSGLVLQTKQSCCIVSSYTMRQEILWTRKLCILLKATIWDTVETYSRDIPDPPWHE